MHVKIFADGSARGNPNGPGGFGTIIQYVDKGGTLHERTFSQGYKLTTNNRMELRGVIAGFRALTKPCEVEVITDSQYVAKAFTEHWIDAWILEDFRRGRKNEVKNIDLWLELLEVMKPHKVAFTWVKGHNGHPENERCDKLATSAADGEDLLEDEALPE